jgi:flagellar biosynthesis protein FlhG
MQDQAASLRRISSRPLRAPSLAFLGASGSGVTTIVTELATAAALAGQRPLVVDCQAGQLLARRLGLPTTGTLQDQAGIASGLSAMMTATRHGALLVNLYARAEDRALFSPQVWLRLTGEFAALERDADLLLIDSPLPVQDPMPAAVADDLVLVLTPHEDSLTSAYASIKRLAAQSGHQMFNVLVNRAKSQAEAHAMFTRLSAVTAEYLAVTLRWLGFVPEEPLIRRSQTLRKPLMETFPDSEAAQAFGQLAALMPQWPSPGSGRPDAGFLDLLIAASRDWMDAPGN